MNIEYIKSNIESRNRSVERLIDCIETLSSEIQNDDNTMGYIGIICFEIKKRIKERKEFENQLNNAN